MRWPWLVSRVSAGSVTALRARWPSPPKPGAVWGRRPASTVARVLCWAPALAPALALALAVALAGAAPVVHAASGGAVVLGATGELAGSVLYQQSAGGSRTLGVLSGRVHLELRPAQGERWWVAAAVEPWLPMGIGGEGPVPRGSVLVTEAYAGLRFQAVDVYLGRFPLPLETARLTLPYTVTPLDEAGRRPGADGLRADVYLPAGRLQLAAVGRGEAWTPLVGWRQSLAGWEVTVYGLAPGGGPVVGVGVSGLVGATVVYGEAWSLAGEQGPRGSVGATGFLGDFLWTVELARAGFAPPSPETPSPPVWLAVAQLAYSPGFGWTVVADASVMLEDGPAAGGSLGGAAGPNPERGHRLGLSVTHELVPGRAELEFSAYRWVPPPYPPSSGAAAGLRWYF